MFALGPFLVDAPIGRGGMGVVWRGRHREAPVDVAVKLVTSHHATTPRFVSAFEDEVRAMAGLEHPGVVRVLEYGRVAEDVDVEGVVPGCPYLVMEYAAGGTLGRALPLPTWTRVRALLAQVLEALAHVHARGVVHRDLKPSNILLHTARDEGAAHVGNVWKIADFGLVHHAAAGDRDPRTMATSGTPAYMAPEQHLGHRWAFGPSTDLYALGCIAWEAVTGRRLFQAPDRASLAALHVHGRVPALSPMLHVPAAVEPWIHRLVAKDPRERFQFAADALAALPGRDADDWIEPAGAKPRTETDVDTATRSGTWATSYAIAARAVVPAPRLKDRQPIAASAPPMSPTWIQAALPPRRPDDIAAGLGLFGLRPVPFVGRRAERDALWAALREVRGGGETGVVAVRGLSGLGKSRLAEWLMQRAHEDGAAHSLRATHTEHGGPADGLRGTVARALQLLRAADEGRRQAFDEAIRRLGCGTRELRRTLTAYLFPETVDEPPLRPQLFGALATLLKALASDRPLVLVIDDAQWAGEALAFARYALDHVSAPWLVVLTVRDDLIGDRALESELLDQIVAQAAAPSLTLGPLSGVEQRELTDTLLGLEDRLNERLISQCQGQPLLLVATLEAWVRSGLLVPRQDAYGLREGAEAGLARDALLAELVEDVLGTLEPLADHALQLAALLGRVVDRDEWAAVCAAAEVPVPEGALDHLARRAILRLDRDSLVFLHEQLRSLVAERCRAASRWEPSHALCARVLADHYAAGYPRRAERVGEHLVAAGDTEAAFAPLLEAARERFHRSEYAASHALLTRRDDLLGDHAGGERDPRWREGAILRQSTCIMEGSPDRADEVGRRILSGRGDAADLSTAWALSGLAWIAFHQRGRVEEAIAYQLDCVGCFEELEDEAGLARAHQVHADFERKLGHLDEARRFNELAWEAYAAREDDRGLIAVWFQRGKVARDAGAFDEARGCFAAMLPLCEGDRHPFDIARAEVALGMVHADLADYAGAREHLHEGLRLSEALGLSWQALEARLCMARCHLVAGEVEQAHRILARTLGAATSEAIPWVETGCVLGLVACAASRGDWDAFDAGWADYQAHRARTPYRDAELPPLADLVARYARASGDPARAALAEAEAETLRTIGDGT